MRSSDGQESNPGPTLRNRGWGTLRFLYLFSIYFNRYPCAADVPIRFNFSETGPRALCLLGLAAEESRNVKVVGRDVLGDVADILLNLMNNGLLFAGG